MKKSTGRQSPIKTPPLNQPGQYLDSQIEIIRLKRFRNLAIFCIFGVVAVYEVLHAYFGLPLQPLFATILALVSGVYVIFREMQLQKDERNMGQGSEGEKTVGDIFDSLKQKGMMVFHGVKFEGANYNIDHVVLSISGIFAVETKARSKSGNEKVSSDGKVIFINGGNPDPAPIDEAVMHASALQMYLYQKTDKRFYVRPVLVYPGWYVTEYIGDKIWVLNPKWLQYKIDTSTEAMSRLDFDKAKLYLEAVSKSSDY